MKLSLTTRRFNFLTFGVAMVVGLLSVRPLESAEPANPIKSSSIEPVLPSMTADLHEFMLEDLRFLTSEALQGRSSIAPTIIEAADYIAGRFHEMGLETELFDGSPLQFVELAVGPKITSQEKNFLRISRSPNTSPDTLPEEQELARDFNPLAIGASDQNAEGTLVWVGYGIRAPERQYDDYAGVNVRGKIVMMLRKEPGANDPNSPFDGVQNTRHAFFQTKVTTAIDEGVTAVLIVNDPTSVEQMLAAVDESRMREQERLIKIRERWQALPETAVNAREKLAKQIERIEKMLAESDEQATAKRGLLDISVAGTSAIHGTARKEEADSEATKAPSPIPVLSISRQLADQLLAGELSKLETEIDSDWQPRSREVSETTVRVGVQLSPSMFRSPNVIGVLPGRGDLAEETLVIGAHYDHVGMGEFGSLAPGTIAIHNGADDNASGTATLLRVAGRLTRELLGENAPPHHRRIVFIAFTGEERGLLGSKHYIAQPRFPLSSTVAMINMDMVGRLNDNELTVYGTGSAVEFRSLLAQLNETGKFRLVEVESGYGPSDHASFYEAGIPVLFFFTGLHSDYHRPSDDFEKLNLDGMTRITDIVSQASTRLATDASRPVYAKTEEKVQIRRQLTVFIGVTLAQQPGRVLLSSVQASGPADEGGLQSGDELLKVDKQSIEHINDLMEQLRLHSPGDVLNVEIRRGSEELKLKIKLRPR
jgi:hypothetical protein